MKCSKCGHSNQAGTKFCESCGNKLELTISEACLKCSKPNLPNYKYCEFCGAAKNANNELKPKLNADTNKTTEDNIPRLEKLPTSNKSAPNNQKKSGLLWIFIFIGVVVVGVAAFFILGKSDKKVDSSKVISSQLKANNTSQGTAEVAPEIFYQQAKPYLLDMLAAIKNKNEKLLAEQIKNINSLKKPNGGDR